MLVPQNKTQRLREQVLGLVLPLGGPPGILVDMSEPHCSKEIGIGILGLHTNRDSRYVMTTADFPIARLGSCRGLQLHSV